MNKKKNLSLFDDDGGEEEDVKDLGFNKGYATKYDNWRRLEEMQKIKDRYGDVDEDSSSSESEPEWTEEHEDAFLKTLGALKSGDRSFFQNGKSYFKEVEEAGSSTMKKKEPKKKAKKDEKVTIKDYERKLVLEKGGQIDESDDDEEIERKEQQHGYHEEQEKLRKSLAAAIHDDDEDDADLLVERKKTKKELEKEDEDFYEWMKHESGKADKTKAKELKHLKKFWKDDANLDESEKFLRDYLMNKDYVPGEKEENPTYDEIVALEADEKDMDKNRQYERKYNFRFEEPDQEFIKQYPRTVNESMRTDNNARKEKRVEREDRKKKEKEEKKKELKELQKMKKSEIEQKLIKLQKAAGCEIPISLDELNADFDPKEFDKKMQQIFNDEYYGVEENVKEDDDEKPVFSDMDDSDYEDYDNMDVNAIKKEEDEEEENDEDEEEDDDHEVKPKKSGIDVKKNGKFDMVAAAQKAMKKDSDENKRKKKKNALKDALAKKKPLFDPKEKTFEQYFNEYYSLDYEDIIGDQITRFKYREVEPNDFGLSTNEILEADERQLNAWASLKKVTAYRSNQEESFDKNAYRRKAQDVEKKKRIFNTDFGGKKSLKRKAEDEEIEKEMNERLEEDAEVRKKKKKRGKKKAKVGGVEKELVEEKEQEEVEKEIPTTITNEEENTEEVAKSEESAPKKNKRKRNKGAASNKTNVLAEKYGHGVTDSRVKAYGLNPNRLKKGLVYGSSSK